MSELWEQEVTQSTENDKGLQAVIRTLKEAAQRFDALFQEAEILFGRKEMSGYEEKLRERAQLIVDLPRQLQIIEDVDAESRRSIMTQVSDLAFVARTVLDRGGNTFGLSVLLTRQGSRRGDKNDLEKLIDRLTNK